CWITPGAPTTLSLTNINTGTNILTHNQELGTVGITVAYTCKGVSGGERPQAKLVLSEQFSKELVTLKNAGLGMRISIGGTTIDWTQLDPGFTGKARAYSFGDRLSLFNDQEENHSAVLNVTVYVDKTFKQNSTRIELNLGSMTIRAGDSLSLAPSGKTNTLNFSPFNINIIAGNLIKLTLSPSSIDIGRFYAEYENKDKQVPFSVTVAQDPLVKAAPNQHFKLPLMIQFGDGKSPPPADLTDSNAVLRIRNDDNELNGLKLFLTKDSNPVYFNKPKLMSSEINIADSPYDSLTDTYVVHVVTEPGTPLKTGPFSVPIPVVITYK
ncbi:hypothetical protein LHS21_005102, partial [Salmonella enterica subsp. enterica serovar Newport]|nr:hypothetical protein [Salmonella enterica subsp. enterica serovar Newport]